MSHKGSHDRGPGMIDVLGRTLTFRVGVHELIQGLGVDDTVFVWTDTKRGNVTDNAPNTESGDGCPKPQVAFEVLLVVLN